MAAYQLESGHSKGGKQFLVGQGGPLHPVCWVVGLGNWGLT